MTTPRGATPFGGMLVSTLGTNARSRIPPTPELRDAGVILLDDGEWWRINPAGDAWIEDAGNLPVGYPASAAELDRRIAQFAAYPELYNVKDMRVAWKAPGTDIEADQFTPANMLAGAVGHSHGTEYTISDAGARDFRYYAIWLSGSDPVFRLTNTINSFWLDDPLDVSWEEPVAMTVDGVEGELYVSLSEWNTSNGTWVARAIMDPGRPA